MICLDFTTLSNVQKHSMLQQLASELGFDLEPKPTGPKFEYLSRYKHPEPRYFITSRLAEREVTKAEWDAYGKAQQADYELRKRRSSSHQVVTECVTQR
jgi:hypothetical protein